MEFQLEDEQLETPVVPAAGKEKEAKDETVTLSKAEVEALRRDRDEARQSEKYWANIARSGGRQAEQPAEEANDDLDASEFLDEEAGDTGLEGDTPEKLVDDLAARGVSAIAKRGFITAKDAHKIAAEMAIKISRKLIGRERQKITSDTQIMSEFPELKDQSSELFKETARIYQAAVAMDPNAKKTPAALFLAAKAAKASLKQAAAPRRGDDRDDNDEERETDRRRRADSQDSRPRGGRGAADEPDDMLGDEARQIIKAMGISEDEYKASLKQTRGAGRRR
jgi:hypothetical protein